MLTEIDKDFYCSIGAFTGKDKCSVGSCNYYGCGIPSQSKKNALIMTADSFTANTLHWNNLKRNTAKNGLARFIPCVHISMNLVMRIVRQNGFYGKMKNSLKEIIVTTQFYTSSAPALPGENRRKIGDRNDRNKTLSVLW